MTSNLLSAQHNCDCAEETRRRPKIIQYFNEGRVDLARREFEAIGATGSPGCRLSYYNSMAQYYFNRNSPDSIPLLMRAEKKLLDSLQCVPQAYGRFYNTYGNYYIIRNDHERAAQFFVKALQYNERAAYVFGQQRALTSLSVVFSQLEQFDKGLEFEKQAEVLARKIKDKNELGIILARKASFYNNLFEEHQQAAYLDSALLCGRESVRLARQTQNVHTLTDAYNNLARQALYRRFWEQGLHYADSALHLMPRDLHHLYKYRALRTKSELYTGLRQLNLAAIYADSSLAEALLFNPQMQIKAWEQVYTIQKRLKDYGRALLAYEKMQVLKDSLMDAQQFRTINELQERYQRVKNEKRIQELTQTRRVNRLQLGLLGLGVVVAVSVIFGLVVLLRQRAMQARQDTLEKEQRLNRARMNPHFFFNALVALQVLAMRTNDGRSIALYLSKFAAIMRQILESTYQEYVSLGQEKAFLEKYLELQRLRFPETFEYTIEIDPQLDLERMVLPPMLVQPFAENAIEHGFRQKGRQNQLWIRFISGADHQLRLEIEDNGLGLDQQLEQKKAHLSRASQIIQDTLAILRQKHQCDAHFSLRNKPEGGVLAQLFLPLMLKPE